MPTSIPRSTTDRNAPKLFSVASRSQTSDGAGNISTTSVGLKNTPRRPVSFLPKITETEALAYIGLVLIFYFFYYSYFFYFFYLFFIFYFFWMVNGRAQMQNRKSAFASDISSLLFLVRRNFLRGFGGFLVPSITAIYKNIMLRVWSFFKYYHVQLKLLGIFVERAYNCGL